MQDSDEKNRLEMSFLGPESCHSRRGKRGAKVVPGIGEVARRFRSPAALPEDPSLSLSTQVRWLTTAYISSSRRSDSLFQSLWEYP